MTYWDWKSVDQFLKKFTEHPVKKYSFFLLVSLHIGFMLCDSQMCKISWTKTNLTLTWLGFCQNPNLTTTQPQPNLNLVGFETIITLHTPTHHYRSSTSTKNNDPMGLKFCRRPYQAKLTTIQHNFNPS